MSDLAVAGKYARVFGVGLKAAVEYRANFLFSIAAAVAPVVIQTALWLALYGNDPTETLFGFTFAQMVAYTVIAQLVSRLVRTGFEYDLNYDIKSGSLDRYLVKPVGYFGYRLFAFLGDKVVSTGVMGLLLAVAVAILSAALGFTVTLAGVALFACALVVAFVLNFLIFWCVGLVGFWLTEIGFLFEAVRIVIIAASGGIFPLAVFGPSLERVLNLLPFRFTIQFPTEILTGRIPQTEILPAFAVAGVWIVALFGLSQFVWSRGLRRFAAVGS
jgi:ABC-2 type transport system permease protein